MTRDRAKDWTRWLNTLPFILHQYTLELYTAMPGLVESYDEFMKRVSVRPAIQFQTGGGEFRSRPILYDVPVLFPAGGGFSMEFTLNPSDPVMLVISNRGMENFVKDNSFGESEPNDHLWDMADAVAIPGFIPTPVRTPETGKYNSVKIRSNDANGPTVGIRRNSADSELVEVEHGDSIIKMSDDRLVMGVGYERAGRRLQFGVHVDRRCHSYRVG